jgi:adenylate cyclase, class 2
LSIGSAIETEIKLRLPDAATGRKLLRRAGLKVKRRRKFESNFVYDTSESSLRQRGELLRLRLSGRDMVLTFKGRPVPARHKTRKELETVLGDITVMDQILRHLGFQVVFRYEKYRTEYSPARGTGVVTLDQTPIGVFLEIEGEAGWIDRTARRLGFNQSEYINASYGSLYASFCAEHGLQKSDMVFPKGHSKSATVPRSRLQ